METFATFSLSFVVKALKAKGIICKQVQCNIHFTNYTGCPIGAVKSVTDKPFVSVASGIVQSVEHYLDGEINRLGIINDLWYKAGKAGKTEDEDLHRKSAGNLSLKIMNLQEKHGL